MVVHRRNKPSKSSRARFNNFLKTQREKNKLRREEVIKNNNLIKTSQTNELEKLTLEIEEKDDNYEELSNLHNNLFERFELAQKEINELNDSNESLQKQLASRDKVFNKSQTKIKAERDKLKNEKMVLTRHNINLRSELEVVNEKLDRFLIKEYEG
jgi:predicted  nucleic acid-binding Zn-ribbon protein